jgi:hypothetical protein
MLGVEKKYANPSRAVSTSTLRCLAGYFELVALYFSAEAILFVIIYEKRNFSVVTINISLDKDFNMVFFD